MCDARVLVEAVNAWIEGLQCHWVQPAAQKRAKFQSLHLATTAISPFIVSAYAGTELHAFVTERSGKRDREVQHKRATWRD